MGADGGQWSSPSATPTARRMVRRSQTPPRRRSKQPDQFVRCGFDKTARDAHLNRSKKRDEASARKTAPELKRINGSRPTKFYHYAHCGTVFLVAERCKPAVNQSLVDCLFYREFIKSPFYELTVFSEHSVIKMGNSNLSHP